MEKFIYVFNAEARDKLLSYGFHMLKSDEENSVYIFANQASMVFALSDTSYFLSNTLTF